MAELDVTASVASDLTNVVTDFSVDTATTDAGSDQKETAWMNTKYSQYLGYYKTIPEVASVIDAKASWTIGKGYQAEPEVEMLLDSIKGNGFDTFNTILENMERTKEIGGDSYAEIIRNDEGILINLKPLDPAVMRHVTNPQGIIIRFEQVSKIKGKKPIKFKPEDIFYLARNRVADEIHGNTMIERLANIILAKNEAMADQKIMFHRFVKPRWIIKLDTAVPSEIAKEKRKWDKSNEDGENMYIPMGTVEVEQMTIAPNSTLNPQTMIESLDNKFYESAQVPKIVVGGAGGFTDAAVKVALLAYAQNIKGRQLNIKEQVLAQLNLIINLLAPVSLENELISDEEKDEENGITQPSEMIAPGVGQLK